MKCKVIVGHFDGLKADFTVGRVGENTHPNRSRVK